MRNKKQWWCHQTTDWAGPLFTLHWKNWERRFHWVNVENVVRLPHAREILTKSRQSLIILDLCLRKTRAEKSRDTQAALAIVSKNSVFKMFFSVHTKTRQRSSNSSDLKNVFEKATFPWREWNFRASQRMRGLSSLNYCLSACFRVLVRQVQPIPTNHAGANKNILTAKCVFLNNFVLSYSPTNVVNMFHCLVSNREGLGTSL